MTAPAPPDRIVLSSFVTAAVAVMAVLSLVPFGAWWAGASASLYFGAWQTWVWGTLVSALLTVLVVMLSRRRAPEAVFGLWGVLLRVSPLRFVVLVAIVVAVLCALMSLAVFAGNPRNVDGFAYLFQARVFLSGRLWAPPPAEPGHFGILQMIMGPDRWYSQYPPGQSVILAAGMALGAWWLLNPLIAATFTLGVYRLAKWCFDESTARLAIVFAAISPFVLATAGSEMSHLSAATLGILAASSATFLNRRGDWLPAAGAGLALGLMTAFRPLDAVAAAVPVAGIVWLAAPASRRIPVLLATAAAGVVATLPTLAYNAATNGSWTTFGYTTLWGPEHSLGFHGVPWGIPLTFTRAIGLTSLDLHHLNAYAFDLPVPILLIILAGLVAGRRSLTSRDAVPVAGAVALSGLLFFFWHRDVFYGPRFIFSAMPWYLILSARALILLRRAGSAGATVAFGTTVAMVVGLVAITPGRLHAFRTAAPALTLHPDQDARQAGLQNAVVVIPDGWGSRLIGRMWDAGISVPASTFFYSAVDACTLELALAEAESDPNRLTRLGHAMDSLAALRRAGVPAQVTEDPNLRLAPDQPLSVRCREQIAFDRRHGVLAFAPFLRLNQPTLDGGVVWARDLADRNAELFARYPGRRFFRYAAVDRGGRPVFTPIDPRL